MSSRLLSVVLSLCAVTACSSSPSDDNAGFYTWVDAQGNLVTVERDDEPEKTSPSASDAASVESPATSAAPRPAVPGDDIVTADNPMALWEAGDEAYISEQEIEARLEARDRERFVSYPDEDGRVVTHPLDMKAVKEASATRDPGYEALEPDAEEYAAGSVALRADCCVEALEGAVELAPGDEFRLAFTGTSVRAVEVDGLRPAMTFRLVSGVARVEVQSWLREQGYIHPRLLFIGQQGEPLLLVDAPFSRRYPESFFVWPSLFGDIPVPADAAWVVVYLPYAGVENGRAFVSGEAIPGTEPGATLQLQGDAVIRAK